jgi:hypothetical protein
MHLPTALLLQVQCRRHLKWKLEIEQKREDAPDLEDGLLGYLPEARDQSVFRDGFHVLALRVAHSIETGHSGLDLDVRGEVSAGRRGRYDDHDASSALVECIGRDHYCRPAPRLLSPGRFPEVDYPRL